MAKYTLIPRQQGERTKEDLELILRRLDHDLEGTLNFSKSILHMLINHDSLALEREKEFLRVAYYGVIHTENIKKAIKRLVFPDYLPWEFNLDNLLKQLKDYPKSKWSHQIDVTTTNPAPDLVASNFIELIYMQTYNFIKNIYDHSGSKPPIPIKISTRTTTLDRNQLPNLGPNQELYDENSSFVVVSVTDHGEGIPADQLPRIFERGHTTKTTGNGVGLALAEMTCDLIHGFVEVESELGKGSTFSLYFAQERR